MQVPPRSPTSGLTAQVLAIVLVAIAVNLWSDASVASGRRAVAEARAATTERPTSTPDEGDEFVGPFPSWTNLKTTYGASGDGITDDTDALQRALARVGTTGWSPVLFVPRGTYRITRTLTFVSKINVSLVGEDPDNTVLIWDGAQGGTMLWVNGLAYSRVSRLTFDGRRRAAVAVEQSWTHERGHFDTGNEYADDRFVDVEYGIHGGFKGFGFAETSILRARFVRNTAAGVALGNFNALDAWIWYSLFDHCATGITNRPGAGNFHVYNSVFRGSTVADLSMGNTGGFSARGNYSTGSRAFFVSGGGTNNPATIDLQRNVVIDPLDARAVRLGNQGPGLLTDNIFRSLPQARGPVVEWASFIGADVMSVGNTFTVPRAVRSNGRLVELDDRVVSGSTLRVPEPRLPPSQPNLERRVFEVPPGMGGGAIQTAVDRALDYAGSRPVVHLPSGSYSVSRTITVPASDLQIVGDGGGTVLMWTGPGVGPLLRLAGPSKASIRELTVDGVGRGDGIVIDDADQAGARIHLQGVQTRSGRETDLLIDRLDHTNVDLEDFGHAYSPAALASVKIVGGPLAAAGAPAGGRTVVFSGASSGLNVGYETSNGGRLLVRDLWYEAGGGPSFVKVRGRASFTIDGARVASPVNGLLPAFDIRDLDGNAAILSTDLDDRIAISGRGADAHVLLAGVFCEHLFADCLLNTTAPPAAVAVVNARQTTAMPATRSVAATNTGQATPDGLRAGLAQTRGALAVTPRSLPVGVTDVRLFRVWVINGRNNIVVTTR